MAPDMTTDEKYKIPGEATVEESRGMDWMFQKARELGFSDVEIKKLKITYNCRIKSDENWNG